MSYPLNLSLLYSFILFFVILLLPHPSNLLSAILLQPAVCCTLATYFLLLDLKIYLFIFLTHKQILDAGRQRLFSVLQERSRVIDLLCHALNSISSAQGNHAKCRVPTSLDGRILDIDSNRFGTAVADALGPYTPEADQVNYTKSNDGVHLSLYTVL